MKLNHTFTVTLIADAEVSASALHEFLRSRLRLEAGTYMVVKPDTQVVIKKINLIAMAREPRPDLVAIRERWSRMRYRGLFVREEHGGLVLRVQEADPEDAYGDLLSVVLRSEVANRNEMEAWGSAADDIAALLKVIDERDDTSAA